MRNIFKALYFLLIILVIQSCYVKQPTYRSVTSPDYNDRQTIEKPGYTTTLTSYGRVSPVVSGIVGGASGLLVGPFERYHLGDRQTTVVNRLGNVLLGASLGVSINMFINNKVGLNKFSPASNYEEWIREVDLNSKYVVINDDNNKILFINRSAQDNYLVKNSKDALDFFIAFPESNNYNSILSKSKQVSSRSELAQIIDINKGKHDVDDLLKHYFDEAKNVDELIYSINKYPDFNYDHEKRALTLISSFKDYFSYIRFYNKTEIDKSILLNIIRNENNRQEFPEFIEKISYDNEVALNAKRKYILLSPDIKSLQLALDKYPNAFNLKYPNYADYDESIGFYKKVVLNLEDRKVRTEFEENFADEYFSSIKSNKSKILAFYNNSPHGYYFIDNCSKIKDVGLSIKHDEVFAYLDKNDGSKSHGYLFYGDGVSYYFGDFVDYQRSGKGFENNPFFRYDGDWVNNMKHGRGEYTSLMCHYTYSGQFEDDAFHGLGRIEYKKGNCYNDNYDWYFGNFENGSKHGNGELRTRDGWRLEGYMVNGVRHGSYILKKWTLLGLISAEYELIYRDGVLINTIEDHNDFDVMFSSSSSGSSSENRSSNSSNSELSVPPVKKEGEWEMDISLGHIGCGDLMVAYIQYRDGVDGYLYYHKKSNRYGVSDGLGPVYYKSKDEALRALYYYKKTNYIPKSKDIPDWN